MFSDYSTVQCHRCGTVWRTNADFVLSLPDGKNLYDLSDGARKAMERPANYEDFWHTAKFQVLSVYTKKGTS